MRELIEINSICDCLCLFTSNVVLFNENNDNNTDELTYEGNIAFEKLRSLIIYLEKVGIVNNFNEDVLDKLVSEKSY